MNDVCGNSNTDRENCTTYLKALCGKVTTGSLKGRFRNLIFKPISYLSDVFYGID